MRINNMNVEQEWDRQQVRFFQNKLLHWHETQNFRSYPWKSEKDPYKIWLSEIILQQTRSDQGLPYYNAFVSAYPTVVDLANAPDDDVFKLWQGLGYYNRCRNLLFTARLIKEEYKGVFPNNYAAILSLKGVGAYTAAAIASFAFDLPYAVVDGNVYRVLSRFLGIDVPIDTSEGNKLFAQLGQHFLAQKSPAAYNQAIMDFGASVCTPKTVQCDSCVLHKACKAHHLGTVASLPVKIKKIKVKERVFNYYLLRFQDHIYIQQRTTKDIWQKLYEPYLIEGDSQEADSKIEQLLRDVSYEMEDASYAVKQRLTHQQIYFKFKEIHLAQIPKGLSALDFLHINKLKNIAFPQTIISFFDNKSYI